MLDKNNLGDASKSLVLTIKKIIDEAFITSQNSNTPIADGNYEGYYSISTFFDSVLIDDRVSEAIILSNDIGLEPGRNVTMGLLIRKSATLNRAKHYVKKAEVYLKSQVIDEVDWDSVLLYEGKIDYLKELFHCLELMRGLVKKSKAVNRKDSDYFLEFCAFCWRLVNKNKFINFDEGEGRSQYYCLTHHPKQSDLNYQRARNSLLSAIDKLNPDVFNEFKARKNMGMVNPFFLYRATSSVVPKPSNIILEGYCDDDGWRGKVNRIINISEGYYPNASSKIAHVDVSSFSSWREWFYFVINALDPSGKEASCWNDTNYSWTSISNDEAAVCFSVGESVVLNILHRYEAVFVINSLPRPRGTKKGSVNKNEDIREAIANIAKKQIEEKGKVNGSAIAKQIGISRQRVSILLKEIKLY